MPLRGSVLCSAMCEDRDFVRSVCRLFYVLGFLPSAGLILSFSFSSLFMSPLHASFRGSVMASFPRVLYWSLSFYFSLMTVCTHLSLEFTKVSRKFKWSPRDQGGRVHLGLSGEIRCFARFLKRV